MDDKLTATYAALKELTLDFVNCRRNRKETVRELRRRIEASFIYGLNGYDLIVEAFVSLDHLTEKGFATSQAEMEYLAACFEEKRVFSRAEARQFVVGPFQDENPPA
jgi:hypothetical protein